MLILSDATWKELLAMLATSPPGVERVAYLDGCRASDGKDDKVGIATTVSVPFAIQRAGHFTVDAEEMSRAGAHLRRYGLVRLAQVHTHPGDDTRHSRTDDENAYSRKAGAVSIVLPRHAAGDPRPTDGTVHVHDGHVWRQLSRREAEGFIRIVPATIDTRPTKTHVPAGESASDHARRWRRCGSWKKVWAHVTRRR